MMKCNTKGTGLGNTEVITRLDGSNIVDVKLYDTIIASIDHTLLVIGQLSYLMVDLEPKQLKRD